jgi:hypothetical protein
MTKSLKRLLTLDIEKSVEALRTPSKFLSCKQKELYGFTHAPITLMFGPDVENLLFRNGRRVMNYYSTPPCEVANYIKALNSDPDILEDSYLDSNNPSHLIDGTMIELRLRPSKAFDAIARFNRIIENSANTAQNHGFEFYAGNGHWHHSAWQGKTSLYGHNYKPSLFQIRMAASILELQYQLPALFFAPHIVDKDIEYGLGRLPHHINLSRSSSFATLRIAFDLEAQRLELRNTVKAPLLPIAVILKSVLYGLTHQGDFTYTTARKTNDSHPQANTFPPCDTFASNGKGSYVDCLIKTRNNPLLAKLFGAELAHDFIEERLSTYCNLFYQDWFTRKYTYMEMDDIQSRLIANFGSLPNQASPRTAKLIA